VTIHDMVWKLHGETMVRLGRLVEALLMPSSLRKADRIIAVSEATAQSIVAFYPDVEAKITVIHEASSLQHLRPSDEPCPQQPYMLFVGTIEPRKNLENILRAFRSLIAAGGDTHRMVIVGNVGWKNENIHRLLRDVTLSSRVVLLGHVPNERLVALYRGADFVVAPSLYEGFGLVVVEAMGFGKPVITANVSALPEVAGDAAILVDPTDVGAITAAMHRLINDRDLHKDLARRSLTKAKAFSWDRTAAETLSVLLDAVANT
jgi:glycosyltransferase involved in cell wall biosynthesis